MVKDVFTYIVGGKAGEGIKKAGSVASNLFVNMKRQVFQMDDYMSLIQGGHNFSVVSSSDRDIYSHYMKAELIVNSDKRSYEKHLDKLTDDGIIVYNSDEMEDVEGIGVPFTSIAKEYKNKDRLFGVGAVAILSSTLGLNKEKMKRVIQDNYPEKSLEENFSYAEKIYENFNPKIPKKFHLKSGDYEKIILTGNQSLSLGAILAGLDCYYAYPMTPSTSILHYLAKLQKRFGLTVVQPENEISVINMAIGSTFSGARTMVGTSGGGFGLMNEGYSLAGMCESPVVIVLSSRTAPASGVPTYTEQADLQYALNAGHGDFLRIVGSPATVEEAFYLCGELFDLAWRFQTPTILLTEKHLSESSMTIDLNPETINWVEPKKSEKESEYKRYVYSSDGISPLQFPPSEQLIKWNSYEHDELGITTEEAEIVTKMHDKRHLKVDTLIKYLKNNIKTVNIYGQSGPIIFTYGSTTMSVLEAVEYGDIEATIVQPIYLRPFPQWEFERYKDAECISVELSRSGQFTKLIKEKCGLKIKTLINQYNGRAFEPIDLSIKIKEAIKK
jgi:2-oxoglutarate ferredoxin oxidoreductase subunit alpha